MKTILFPTDFSQVSINALGSATAFARILSARIVLLYAVRSYADRDKFLVKTPIGNEAEAIEAMKQLCSRFSGEIHCEYLAKTGIVNDEIASAAKDTGADLIVMGTAGAGEIPDTLALLNSTTTALISKRVCPVLAVPAGATLTQLSKIVLAVDNQPLKANILALVSEIALVTKAEVLLLTVTGEEQTSEEGPLRKDENIAKVFSGIPYSVHTIRSKEITASIHQYALQEGASLITVIARKQGLIDFLFNESVSQKLALRSQLPLLVLPE